MTYYIDPTSGDDGNTGCEPTQAWRTFAPLNRRHLVCGEAVEVMAPGAFHEGLILRGGGSAEAPLTVHFAPGRYDLYPDHTRARIYSISNCNADPDTPKPVGILFDRAHHIRVEGEGAQFVCRGKMIEVCVDHSQGITLSGLTFDYHRPTMSEFKVTAATDDYADLTIHPDSTYRVEDGRIVWEGEGWTYDTCLTQELDPEREVIWRRRNPLEDARMEALAPRHVRAHGSHGLVEGHIYQQRNPFRDCCGVFMNRSRDVCFEDLHFLYLHGMGILCQFTENITLDRVSIAPDPESGRTCAAWADCFHASGCGGRILVRDCVFDGAHDDAINIHGTHLRILEQVDSHRINVRFMHSQTYGFMAFAPGDDIDFVRWDSLAVFGSNRVVAVEMIDPCVLQLTLKDPVPDDWHVNDVIENVTWTAEVQITGCTVKRVPTRGFLVATRRKVVIRNNTFYRPYMNGLHIVSDAKDWFESGCVRDMTIADNTFTECRKVAIRISPNNTVTNTAAYENIHITDNIFTLAEAGAVDVKGVRGLSITGNTVTAPSGIDPADAFDIRECEDVEISGNGPARRPQGNAREAVPGKSGME